MKLKYFREWIVSNYAKSDGAVGDLARDVKSDARFPGRAIDESVILGYLRSRGVCDAAMETFSQAWAFMN
ncbi:YozE SAM-like domain protein [Acididesulfobacillus acetoxydans]|uniref:YozE SAM-like domain protein n=1 Tax=Acididesulfobacillus acetoxydans TaxID=1561005 RepID=A0A8S0W4I8_9FIRM|nr:YozE family protein [Acididesulfobacillus acetoxydans]CAA7602458.1 YozE SAM-like domain protein [Acididesulfobacillus acetoxydans]CEJ05913.1 Protein of unknown function (DUF1250) [Acididesulfobacillus acetoxydans]